MSEPSDDRAAPFTLSVCELGECVIRVQEGLAPSRVIPERE